MATAHLKLWSWGIATGHPLCFLLPQGGSRTPPGSRVKGTPARASWLQNCRRLQPVPQHLFFTSHLTLPLRTLVLLRMLSVYKDRATAAKCWAELGYKDRKRLYLQRSCTVEETKKKPRVNARPGEVPKPASLLAMPATPPPPLLSPSPHPQQVKASPCVPHLNHSSHWGCGMDGQDGKFPNSQPSAQDPGVTLSWPSL